MDENKKEIIGHIDLLLQKIYSLRQTIFLQEEMDKHKKEIYPYRLVFSKFYHSLTDTLVIGFTSLFEDQKNNDTLSILTLLRDLEKKQNFFEDVSNWRKKIQSKDSNKDSLFKMRNKFDRGHLSKIIFEESNQEKIWKIPYSYEEVRDILKMLEECLCFITKCYELNFDKIQSSVIANQQSIDFAKEVYLFLQKINNR